MTVSDLLKLLLIKDENTYQHSCRVWNYANLIAQQLPFTVDLINLQSAALLHDFGKLFVDKSILNKASTLTDKERLIIKTHAPLGAMALDLLGFPEEVIQMVKYHHIRFDGHGYPENRLQENIPLEWFILPLADSFDAMTHQRPYSVPMSEQQAIEEIIRCKGSQFHPVIVDAFLKAINYKCITERSN